MTKLLPAVVDRLRAIVGRSARGETSRIPEIVWPGQRTDDRLAIVALRDQAAAVGLQELFRKAHFDICKLRSIIECARIVPDGELIAILQPLHCVDWADIPRELRVELQARIIAMFKPAEPEAAEA